MRDYDRLPAELRRWLASAILPWRAKSVQRAYDKALARTGDRALALQELADVPRVDYLGEHGFLAIPIEPAYARGVTDVARFLTGEFAP